MATPIPVRNWGDSIASLRPQTAGSYGSAVGRSFREVAVAFLLCSAGVLGVPVCGRFVVGSIEERFLGCACWHPSQKARRIEEKNRQTPLGMTACACWGNEERFFDCVSRRFAQKPKARDTSLRMTNL